MLDKAYGERDSMKVFLLKDIEKIGMQGEVVKVGDGFARNYLVPRKLAVEITKKNETFYKGKITEVEHRKDVITSKTSMLAKHIGEMKITLKRKVHDDGKLYGAVNPGEVVDLLADQGVNIGKSQVIFNKSIKAKGSYPVTIKLTSKLKPQVTLNIVAEKTAGK